MYYCYQVFGRKWRKHQKKPLNYFEYVDLALMFVVKCFKRLKANEQTRYFKEWLNAPERNKIGKVLNTCQLHKLKGYIQEVLMS